MPGLLRFGSIADAAESGLCHSYLPRTFLHYFIIMLDRASFADRTDGFNSDQTQNKDLIIARFDILKTSKNIKGVK